MAPRANEFEQEMVKLEAEIKRLEAEYNMFFAGRLPRLPWETRRRVEALVKHYDRMQIPNTAQKFRFSTLQSRYVAFCELWERHLKAREEGRPTRGRRSPGAAAAPPPAPGPAAPAGAHAPAPAADAPAPVARAARAGHKEPKESGPRVVASAAIRDPTKDTDRLKELYDKLSSARKKAGEEPLPFDSFAKVVRAQVSKLGRDGTEVSFRVAMQGGKVTLKATTGKDGE
jgi:hypothetical protein